MADDFFKFGSPVGETIKIGSEEYRVVGVLQKREQFLFSGGSDDQNNVIYMPYNVARKLKPNSDDIYLLAVATTGHDEGGHGPGHRHAARPPPGSVRPAGQLWYRNNRII